MAIADKLTKLQTDISSAYTTIASKGGTMPSDKNTDNLSTAINSIPSGPAPEVVSKDVNFYDYDGTRLYSYTQSEFAQLQSMPANPTHEGLTAQGWNWDLSDAQTYVAKYGILDIGQDYKTDDDTIRYYAEFDDNLALQMTIKLTSTDTSTIDWGDNTTSNVVAGTDIETTHYYNSTGKYRIKISSNGIITISNSTLGMGRAKIHKIELPDTIAVADVQNLFYDFGNLETIIIPYKASPILNVNRSNSLQNSRSLKHLTIPRGTLTLPQYFLENSPNLKSISFPQSFNGDFKMYMFTNCTNLPRITLPLLVRFGGGSIFSYCANINRLIMPSTVTQISTNAFANLRHCYLFDFTNHASVPTLSNVSAFSGINVDYKIVVPDSLYNTWITTNNWSNSSIVGHIVKASDYYGS